MLSFPYEPHQCGAGFDDTDKDLSRPQPLQAAGFGSTDKDLSRLQPLQAAGFDSTDKGLSRPQPLQAAGFDSTDKGLSRLQPLQAAGFDDAGQGIWKIFLDDLVESDYNCSTEIRLVNQETLYPPISRNFRLLPGNYPMVQRTHLAPPGRYVRLIAAVRQVKIVC